MARIGCGMGDLECVVVRPLGRQPPTQMPITTSTTPKPYVGPLDVGGKTVGKNSVRDCDSGADEAPQAPIGAHTACIRQLVVSIAALHRSLKYHLSQYKNDPLPQQLSGTQTGGSQTTSQHLDSIESCSKRPCTPAAAAGQSRQQAAGGVQATPAGCSRSAAGCRSWLDSTATTGSSCFLGYTGRVQVAGRQVSHGAGVGSGNSLRSWPQLASIARELWCCLQPPVYLYRPSICMHACTRHADDPCTLIASTSLAL